MHTGGSPIDPHRATRRFLLGEGDIPDSAHSLTRDESGKPLRSRVGVTAGAKIGLERERVRVGVTVGAEVPLEANGERPRRREC